MKCYIKVAAFAATLFSLCSCSRLKQTDNKEILKHKNASETLTAVKEINQKKEQALKKYIQMLSVEEKLSQIFLINLEHNDSFLPVEWYKKSEQQPDGTFKEVKRTLIPAGYIFFGYNIAENPESVIGFTDSIISHAVEQGSIAPFLSIDVEGGFVNRLRGLAGPLPENERVSSVLSRSQSYKLYSSYAKQMSALGFNLDLAPVAEICTDENKDFLNGRSYGTKNQAIDYSKSFIRAFQDNNVGCVVKHFPGNTNVDPHIGLPKIQMTQAEYADILEVFSQVLKERPDAVLMSHVIVPPYDDHPSCLSKFWVTEVLRDTLKYDGIIFSDDIFMGALIDNGYSPKTASTMALDAGITCIMISEKKFGKWMELLTKLCVNDSAFMAKVDEAVFKMLRFKMKHGLIDCNLNAESGEYEVDLKAPLEFYNEQNKNSRLELFEKNKLETKNIYNKYFYATASDQEKRGLFVE